MAVPRSICFFSIACALALTVGSVSPAQMPLEPEEIVVTGDRSKVWQSADPVVNRLRDRLLPHARFRIGSNLLLHPSSGVDLALSPDDKLLVSWGGGSIVGWDAESGVKKWESEFDGEWESIFGTRAIAFSPDGSWIYSQSEPNELLKWSSDAGSSQRLPVTHALPLTAENRPASAHPGAVRTVDICKTDGRVAAAGAHGIVVYDAKGISQFEIPNTPAKAVSPEEWKAEPWLFNGHYSFAVFSTDGRTLAVVRSQAPETVDLFDAATGKELRSIEVQGRVVRVAFSPSNEALAILERHGRISQYAVESGACRWVASNESDERPVQLIALQYTPDGKRVVAAGDMIQALNASDGNLIAKPQSPTDSTRALAFRSDSKVMYSIAISGRISSWDLDKLELLGPQLSVRSAATFATAAGTDKFAFVDLSGVIRVCDAASTPSPSSEGDRFPFQLPSLTRLAMSRDGKRLAAASKIGEELEVQVFALDGELSKTKLIATAKANLAAKDDLKLLEVSPNGNFVAAAITGRNEVMLWDAANGNLLWSRELASLNCLTFSRNGDQLLTGGDDDPLRRWNCESGELLSEKRIEGGALQNVRCSPTSDLIITAHFPNVLRLWKGSDMSLKKRVALSGETNFAALDFSANGNWVATTSSGYLLVVDSSSGEVVWKDALHPSGRVNYVGFSTDDKRLLSVGRDGVGYCWDLLTDQLGRQDFASIWSALKTDDERWLRELQWMLVQIGDPAVEAIEGELDSVTRVVSANAIVRGLDRPAALRRLELMYQLCEKDSTVEVDSRVRPAVKSLAMLRTPRAIALLTRWAADHDNKEIRKEAMFALEQIQAP